MFCTLQTLLRTLDELQTRVQSFSDWGQGVSGPWLRQAYGSLETNHTCLCFRNEVVRTASRLTLRRLGTVCRCPACGLTGSSALNAAESWNGRLTNCAHASPQERGHRTDGGRCPIKIVRHARERSVSWQSLRRPVRNRDTKTRNLATLPRARKQPEVLTEMAYTLAATLSTAKPLLPKNPVREQAAR